MQQTKTYKFNLIESSDTFSPDPLNENTEKTEAALSKVETALSNTEKQLTQRISNTGTQLDQRVTKLEAHKMVTGYHTGVGIENLGFTPAVVFANNGYSSVFAIKGYGMGAGSGGIAIVEGGFSCNTDSANCWYAAFV